MTGYVYTIAGGKGGVGKTTTAVNVAVALEEAGHDVVVVDADLAMANLGAMLEVDHEPTLHDVLAGTAAVSDALVEGPGGITLVPGDRDLEAFADADPAKLRKVVSALQTAYEMVIVDTGAGLSHETTVPLGLADQVLLVTTDDDLAVGDGLKTVELAERVDGEVVGAVLARAGEDADVSAVADRLDLEMLAVVPEDSEAAADEPLVLTAPDSHAAAAYRRLATSLEEIYRARTGAEPAVEPDPAPEPEPADEEAQADDAEDEGEESSGVLGGLFR